MRQEFQAGRTPSAARTPPLAPRLDAARGGEGDDKSLAARRRWEALVLLSGKATEEENQEEPNVLAPSPPSPQLGQLRDITAEDGLLLQSTVGLPVPDQQTAPKHKPKCLKT